MNAVTGPSGSPGASQRWWARAAFAALVVAVVLPIVVAGFFGTLTLMVVAAVYGTHLLGYSEFAELGRSVGSVIKNARTVIREKLLAAEVAERIRRAKSFEEIRALPGTVRARMLCRKA